MILQYPSPILSNKTINITEDPTGIIWSQIQNVIFQLGAMPNALAIASNQMGYKHSFFVYKDMEDPKYNRVVINPMILETRGKPYLVEEGCLSFEGELFNVYRYPYITVQYSDKITNPVAHKAVCLQGLEAQIFQHEIDHLNGLTVLDRI